MNKNGFAPIAIIVLVVVVLGAIGYFVITKNNSVSTIPPHTPSTNNQTPTPTQTSSTDETANWKTYRNEKYGFEFEYPSGAVVSDDPEEGEIKLQVMPHPEYVSVLISSPMAKDMPAESQDLIIK